MSGLVIKRLFYLALFSFFMGCSLSSATTQIPPFSDDNSEGKPASYFVEIRMKGESVTGRFTQASANAYPNGVEIQIMHLPIKDAFVSFEGNYTLNDGSHQIYGFSEITGNHFDTRRHITASNLKTPENNKTLHIYYWIKKKAFLFDRNNLYLTVPAHLFDADIHQNVARFTVTTYPDFDDTRKASIVFDGFKPK